MTGRPAGAGPSRGTRRPARKPAVLTPDVVQRAAVSFVLVAAAVALTATGLLPVVGAVPVAVVAAAGVWLEAGRTSHEALVSAGRLAVLAAAALLLVGAFLRAEPLGRSVLLVTVTGLTMAASALELPTTRSLLMRSWLGCGAALLAVSLADRPVTRVCVVACIAGTLLSLARWTQHPPAALGVPEAGGAAGGGAAASGASGGGAPRGATLRWSVLPAATVVLSALAAVLIVGIAAERQGLQEFWSGRSSSGGAGTGAFGDEGRDDAGSAAPERSTSAYVGGQMSLDARGDLDDVPLFRVPAADGALWRAAVLDDYDGRSWLATGSTPTLLPQDPGRAMVVDHEGPDVARGAEFTSRVEVLDGGFEVSVIAPGPVASVTVPPQAVGAYETLDVVGSGPGSRVFLSDPDGGPAPSSYAVTWQDPDGAEYPDLSAEALERSTRLPLTSERTDELSRALVPDASDPVAAVAAIESDLRARATYNLDSPVAPPGTDSVEDFLFRSHEGFCEHFASAEVVLLRLAGIPARIATGFAAPASTTPDGLSVITGAEAHAWVEFWVPGRGWVGTDPTAGTRQTPTFGERLADVVRRITDSPPLLALVIVVLLLVVGGAAAGIALLLRRRGAAIRARSGRMLRAWRAFVLHRVLRRPLPPQPEPGLPTLPASLAQAYRDLRSALSGTGPSPAPAEGMRSVALRAAVVAGLPTDELEALLWAVEVVERAAFASAPPSQEQVDRAATVLVAATRTVREARSGGRVAVGSGSGSGSGSGGSFSART